MAEKKKEQKQEQKQTPKDASTYTLSELVNSAKSAFGVSPEVVEGALHNESKTEFTKSEVKSAIENFLKRKV